VNGTSAVGDLSACCPAGSTARGDGFGCKTLRLCAKDEFLSSDDSSDEQVCKKCNNVMSILLVGVSLLSFVAITYYINGKVKRKSAMVCSATRFRTPNHTWLKR
jgi:hypothetical protein